MRRLNELSFVFEHPNWAVNPEFAVIDEILTRHPELYDIVAVDFQGKESKRLGRKDTPTIEQVLRGAFYKEMKRLTYRELEYAQHDSRLCALFVKLDGREPFSFSVWQKYISMIRAETLERVMVAINKIVQGEGLEDFSKVRSDATGVKANIHYPTNNALMWDCIKTIDRFLMKLRKETGGFFSMRCYTKRAKKHYGAINNTKSDEKREALFKKQLKLFRASLHQAEKVVVLLEGFLGEAIQRHRAELSELLSKAEKVYAMTFRHEILGESVPNEEKLFSIYEDHTDILVKGGRDVLFGHKVNLTTGRSSLIIDCTILDGNPKDTQAYEGILDRIRERYGVVPRDITTDGGYASFANQRKAQEIGIVNIVFNKIVGSLKNLTSSLNMETRLKKWRSGMEAVISNLKRGFDLFRCEWKTRAHFDAKIYWSVLAYNIRVLTNMLMGRLQRVE